MKIKATMLVNLSTALFVGLFLIGCGEMRATAVSTGTLTPISVISPTPLATTGARLTPTPTVSFVLTPMSAPAAVNHPYPFELTTHCGVNYAVDFNGSFWDATIPVYEGAGTAPTPIDQPTQKGTMTLQDADHAQFDYGNQRIPFRRHLGPKIVHGLCA